MTDETKSRVIRKGASGAVVAAPSVGAAIIATELIVSINPELLTKHETWLMITLTTAFGVAANIARNWVKYTFKVPGL